MVVVAVAGRAVRHARARGPAPDPDRVGRTTGRRGPGGRRGRARSWDPARIGDATSAAILAQTWEGLTTLDANAQVRPALARDWERAGRRPAHRVPPARRHHLQRRHAHHRRGRGGIVAARAGPGATPARSRGCWGISSAPGSTSTAPAMPRPSRIRADGGTVTVDFRRPAAFFPAAAASPTLAVVPGVLGRCGRGPVRPRGRARGRPGRTSRPRRMRRSITLAANPAYWAGAPAIGDGRHAHRHRRPQPGGGLPVGGCGLRDRERRRRHVARATTAPGAAAAAQRRPVGAATTASTPRARRSTTRASGAPSRWPWTGTAWCGSTTRRRSWPPRSCPPASRGAATADLSPVHDPDAARAELAAAGYPGGEGLPPITMITGGGGTGRRAVARGAGARAGHTRGGRDDALRRLQRAAWPSDPPQIFSVDWIADYPHPHDFLGLLLGDRQRRNTGRWSDPAFDAMLEAAASTVDPARAGGRLHRRRSASSPSRRRSSRCATARRGRSAGMGCWAPTRRAWATCASPASTGRTADAHRPARRPGPGARLALLIVALLLLPAATPCRRRRRRSGSTPPPPPGPCWRPWCSRCRSHGPWSRCAWSC